MFSIIPKIGTLTFLNMLSPFLASIKDKSWGVDTIIAPASLTLCDKVNCASPVPGGISIIKISKSCQSTSLNNCSIALITIGPRHIVAASSGTKYPIDIACNPKALCGIIFFPLLLGLLLIPVNFGRLGP